MLPRILVVDDEPVNRDLLQRKITRAGYEAAVACDGAEALACIDSDDFDLVLLDIMMPGMDGIQALERIRERYSPEQLPVIMVTAMTDSSDVSGAIGKGASDYVVKPIDYEILLARVDRQLQLKQASDSLEAEARHLRGEVQMQVDRVDAEIGERQRAEHELRRAKFCLDHASDAIFGIACDGSIIYVNNAASEVSGFRSEQLTGMSIVDLYPDLASKGFDDLWRQTCDSRSTTVRRLLHRNGGDKRSTEMTFDYIVVDEAEQLFAYVRDVTDRDMAEAQLQQARKLEAIGQLAAGIAHEINTPLQFVGDNTSFLESAFDDLLTVQEQFAKLIEAARSGEVDAALIEAVDKACEAADIEYLREEIPSAVRQSADGIERVTAIVRAMKEFSHPGTDGKQFADLNQIVRSAATVSTNEWKYVADLDLELDEAMPNVLCHSQELSQVLVNLLVNAAHAIEAAVGGEPSADTRGRIGISTRFVDDVAEIRISDTGCGIPDGIRDRIFDPFITTKEVGKGTGQGLAIAYSTVVDKHGGEFSVDSVVGDGTTFAIRIPIAENELPDAEVA